MGLLQPSNVSPSTKAGYGKMAVYSSEQTTISWQINGDVPISGYKIDFYLNDTASTLKGSTGNISITPILPKDENGNANRVSWTGILGNSPYNVTPVGNAVTEYKYKITQYWNNGFTDKIEQIDFNVFYVCGTTRGTVSIAQTFPTYPITTLKATVTQTNDYSSYQRVQWRFYVNNVLTEEYPIIDTTDFTKNTIDLAVNLRQALVYVYNQYGESINGSLLMTYSTRTNYTTTSNLTVQNEDKEKGDMSVFWSVPSIYGSSLLLEIIETKDNIQRKLYIHDAKKGSLGTKFKIYSAKSGAKYKFNYLFNYSSSNKGQCIGQKEYCYQRDYYVLIEAKKMTSYNYVCQNYVYIKNWNFKNNVSTSAITNNNTPAMQENFTGYRLKQPSSRKGRSGTLSALLSNVTYTNGIPDYNDTALQMQELFDASLSGNHFFLMTPKGDKIKVVLSQPIQQTVNDKTGKRQVSISIGWEEIEDASDIVVYSPEGVN